MKHPPAFKSRRYEKCIKECINSVCKSKNNVHRHIAKMIASYSHQTLLKPGHELIDSKLHFFVIEDILSEHFLKGYFCCGRIVHTGTHYWYAPNKRYRDVSVTKKIMKPFSNHPHVRVRKRKYYLVKPKRHESLYNLSGLII